jgi:hypothetical protein
MKLSRRQELIDKVKLHGIYIEEVELDEGFINIGGAKVKDDEKSILQHIKKTFPNVKKVRKDPQHGWIPVFEEVDIVDDGTLDTVVSFKDTLYRFDSEYRFSFDSDKAFLKEVKEDLVTQIDWWENK